MPEKLLPLNFMHALHAHSAHDQTSSSPGAERLDPAYCTTRDAVPLFFAREGMPLGFVGDGVLDVVVHALMVRY